MDVGRCGASVQVLTPSRNLAYDCEVVPEQPQRWQRRGIDPPSSAEGLEIFERWYKHPCRDRVLVSLIWKARFKSQFYLTCIAERLDLRSRLRALGWRTVDHALKALLCGRELWYVVFWMCAPYMFLH